MDANNHTIGNWKTGRPYATTGVIPIRNDNGITVAHVTHPNWGYDDTPRTDAEAKANARLIAASPRMYEALKGAREAMRKALPFLPADSEAVFCGEWLDEINQTISEAESKA